MNSALKDKVFPLEMNLYKTLLTTFNRYRDNKGTPNLKRVIGLIRSVETDGTKFTPQLTYAQIKKFKNYFDNFDGDTNSEEYKLIGGDLMKNFVDSALGSSRNAIENPKNARRLAGEENQFQKEGGEKDNNSNPTAVKMPKMHKIARTKNAIMLDTSFTEQVNRIKQLMEHMNK